MSTPARVKPALGVFGALLLALSAGPAWSAGFGLLGTLAERPFVTVDGKGGPAPLKIVAAGDSRVEVWSGGQLAEIYTLDGPQAGRRLNPAAPDLGEPASYDADGWTVAAAGGAVRYVLAADGAIVGNRSEDAAPEFRKQFHLAFPPTAPDLADRLAKEREEIIAEALRVDGHHDDPHF